MRTFVSAIVALAALASVSCDTVSREGFSITGSVEGLDSGVVKVIDEECNLLDSTTFDNGSFVVKGRVDQPVFVYVIVEDGDGNNCIFSRLLAENCDMLMHVDAAERRASFDGAALHDEYMGYVRYLLAMPEQRTVQRLYDDLNVARANGDRSGEERIGRELSEMRDTVIARLMGYGRNAARSQAAAALVYDQTSIHGIGEKRFAISMFDPDFNDSYYLNRLRREVESAGAGTVGSCACAGTPDLGGTYRGTIPAADCPGIDVTVEIGRDGTFRMVYDYVDRDGVFESAGRYELRGNRLIAVGDGSDSTIFRMEGDRLRMLDSRGEAITGPLEDMFILEKRRPGSE